MCLQVIADALDEAVLRTSVRDNTVNRSTADAQTFYSFYLLPRAHLILLDCCLFFYKARVLAGDIERLPALHSKQQGQSCYNINGSVPPKSIQIEPLLARLHSACFLVWKNRYELATGQESTDAVEERKSTWKAEVNRGHKVQAVIFRLSH